MKRTIQGRGLLLAVAAALVAAAGAWGAAYEQTTGARTTTFTTSEVDRDGTIRVHTETAAGGSEDFVLDESLATMSWRYRRPNGSSDFTALREGNRIIVHGIVNGKQVSRSISIDGAPWYQSIDRSLRSFALGSIDPHPPLQFWLLEPHDLSAFKLQAERAGVETLGLPSGPTPAVKVRVSLTGLLSFMFTSWYWFRSDDGTFVRYEGVRGAPGSPKTIITLVRSNAQ